MYGNYRTDEDGLRREIRQFQVIRVSHHGDQSPRRNFHQIRTHLILDMDKRNTQRRSLSICAMQPLFIENLGITLGSLMRMSFLSLGNPPPSEFLSTDICNLHIININRRTIISQLPNPEAEMSSIIRK